MNELPQLEFNLITDVQSTLSDDAGEIIELAVLNGVLQWLIKSPVLTKLK
ncbi:hypothetical protein AB0758_45610 [Tolypothrix bouteillei VB521301_2]